MLSLESPPLALFHPLRERARFGAALAAGVVA